MNFAIPAGAGGRVIVAIGFGMSKGFLGNFGAGAAVNQRNDPARQVGGTLPHEVGRGRDGVASSLEVSAPREHYSISGKSGGPPDGSTGMATVRPR